MKIDRIITHQKIKCETLARARQLRSQMTDAEKTLWRHLRANRLGGFHFRRQQIIQGFIVDFYCHGSGLAIEIDGPVHTQQAEYDLARQSRLEELGLKVLRFRNEQINSEIDAVLKEILESCQDLSPSPPSLKGRGPGG